MHDMMGSMDAEMQKHRDGMTGAADLDAARIVCTQHTDVMNGTLDNMQVTLGSMGCMMR